MPLPFEADIKAVQSLSAVPTIMRVIAETTGLGWVCVSRVTPDAWTMCAVRDRLGFGLEPGDQIDIANTFCDQVRRLDAGVVIDDVSNDPRYRDHPIPKMFGFGSYFSIPVHRADGSFFGTLCGLDPKPARLTDPRILDTLKLFAELLSGQIESEIRLGDAERELDAERQTAELREQFIAVLGHDLRTPLSSILTGAETLRHVAPNAQVLAVSDRISRSGHRIASLVDDVMDFTRGKMGGALPTQRRAEPGLRDALGHVVAELRSAHPGHLVESDMNFEGAVFCDEKRIAQLASNLIVNAIVHGSPDHPVSVRARLSEGRFELAVSNGGAPIPPESAARLFEPFWRGASASKSNGLGLGLYIASQVAKSHGGSLTVASDETGTVFTLTMDSGPSGDEQAPTRTPAATNALGDGLRGAVPR